MNGEYTLSRRAKTILIIVAVLSILYAALSALGIAGVESGTGGLIYRLVIIIVLVFSCSRVFAGAGWDDTVLAGILGLCAFAIYEIYIFAYIYLFRGDFNDLTINNYTRSCAYLFFLIATINLIPPILKSYKIIRATVGVITSIAIGMIFYAIVSNNYLILTLSTVAVTTLCFIASIILFFHNKNGKAERLFSVAVIIIYLLGAANQILLFANIGGSLLDSVISFYPGAYFLLGYALVRLRIPLPGGVAPFPSVEGCPKGGVVCDGVVKTEEVAANE